MLRINNKRIIPAPFVVINKALTFTADGQPLSTRFNISLNGTLLPNKGSPLSTGWYNGAGDPNTESFVTDTEKHDAILRKQQLLREEFSKPQLLFEYWGSSGDPVYCQPKLLSIDFPAGQWVQLGTYSINLETPQINLLAATGVEDTFITAASGLYLTSASDDVQINERDDGTGIYEIVRTISAQGISYASGCPNPTEPWKNAKTWVNYRLTNYPFPSGDNRFSLTSSTGWYNLVQSEDINRYNGTYSVNQRYLYHTNNYTENRSVSKTIEKPRNADGGPTLTNISVQGIIQGLDASNNPTNKLVNARAYYNSITGVIGLTVGAYGQSTNNNYVEDNNAGQIQYSFQFINSTGSRYTHNYDVSFSFAQSTPQVTIQGNIEGISEDTFFNTPNGETKFNRAATGWVNIKDSLKLLAFAQNAIFGGPLYSSGFSDVPIAKQVSYNQVIGTVQYQYVYGWKGGTGDSKFNEEYEIQFQTNNSQHSPTLGGISVQGTINGRIIGLANSGTPDDPTSKYSNAKYGFLQVTGSFFNRVNSESTSVGGISYPLNSRPSNRVIGMDSTNGIITYSYTYNNIPSPSISIVANEDIQIQDSYGGRIAAIQIIPGRSAGPILQDIGTRSEKRRTISLNWSLYPSGNTFWTFGDKNLIANLASGIMDDYVPVSSSSVFLINDNDSWDYKQGVYSRNMEFLYT